MLSSLHLIKKVKPRTESWAQLEVSRISQGLERDKVEVKMLALHATNPGWLSASHMVSWALKSGPWTENQWPWTLFGVTLKSTLPNIKTQGLLQGPFALWQQNGLWLFGDGDRSEGVGPEVVASLTSRIFRHSLWRLFSGEATCLP